VADIGWVVKNTAGKCAAVDELEAAGCSVECVALEAWPFSVVGVSIFGLCINDQVLIVAN
jgi:hypothetical protein